MVRRLFVALALVAWTALAAIALVWPDVLWLALLLAPLTVLGIFDMLQREHTLLRIYPVIGHARYLLEFVRPEIQQYFVESNLDGRPYPREFRAVIYQRAKGERDTVPFGTQRDLNAVGCEWMAHSLAPRPPSETPRLLFGAECCKQPYSASYLNISAMSYGSLSRNAVMALNLAAKQGHFAHNTGEGSASPYHRKYGGDLIWQIGTGYFGCRDSAGNFDPQRFADVAAVESIKMIELKLSQGAKPGHGGILPAAKLTAEIAEIRGVPLGADVISPPAHTAFASPKGLLEFVASLREASGGKPTGFKLCLGNQVEFLSVCKAMVQTGIYPDFITVDGAEGGTGAAPIELSNSVGMPLADGLNFVHNALRGYDLRGKIRLVASGKVATGFHIVRALALGADCCNAARAMMFALGCIQARRCNANDCPVGITTQQPARYRALDVEKKAERVARYHKDTLHAFAELIGACGLDDPRDLTAAHVLRRVGPVTIRSFAEVYPELPVGALQDALSAPTRWRELCAAASAEHFGGVSVRAPLPVASPESAFKSAETAPPKRRLPEALR
ncbi:MAG: FMN-binding glutamate synthase family protein [Deltaproteobacteria bacterium]|nr:FMN-binding glutamate synthase family protein [Deltaproteobacteria bacterium]